MRKTRTAVLAKRTVSGDSGQVPITRPGVLRTRAFLWLPGLRPCLVPG